MYNEYGGIMKSIREIAKLSGVSTATVSRYMNNSSKVSDKATQKIEKVLSKHEYHPNKLTTAIINGRSFEIALIVQNIMNPFFSQLVDEVEKRIEDTEYNLIICNCNGSLDKERRYYKNLLEKRIAGILVINTNDVTIYENKAVPIIGIEKRILDFPKVAISNQKALNLIFDNVPISNCHTLMIKGPANSHSSNLREKHFKILAEENNCTYDLIEVSDDVERLKDITYIDYSKYDTVFCWTDIVAHKVHSEIIAQGLKVPNDIQLVGFDGLTLNNIFNYRLTTIDQQISNIGNVAINNLINSIQGQEVEDVYLDCNFIKGDTTR